MKHYALFVLVVFLTSCGGDKTEPKQDPVEQTVQVVVEPKTAELRVNQASSFLATVTGTMNTAVTWTTSGGTITAAGLYTAPATPGTYQVVATSVAAPSKSAAAVVTVNPLPVLVSLDKTTVTGIGCEKVQFTATVSGGRGNRAVTWAIADPPIAGGPALGSIDTNGLYTLPNPMPYATMVTHITATSVEDPTVVASATVTTNTSITGVTVTPVSATLQVNGAQSFAATVKTSCDP